MSLELRAILAGIFFGAWPLLMNKSGLNGNVSAAMFSLVVFVIVLPFAIQSGGSTVKDAVWPFAISACIAGAIGLLSFNGMLAEAAAVKVSVGGLIVLMTVVQICVPATYQTVTAGLTTTRAVGFVFAIVAAILLGR